jgi:DNA-binding MarR family transcriptional regulator
VTTQPPGNGNSAAAPAAGESLDRFFAGLAIKRAQHEFRLALNAELVPLDTTVSQLNVLREVKSNPGVSSVELARLAFLTPQSLGQQVAQMEKCGLVERRPGPGRKLSHYLTEAGEWLYREAMMRSLGVCDQVLRDFSGSDLAALRETMNEIEARATEVRTHQKHLAVVDPDAG